MTERDAIATFLAVADGSMDEPALAAWLEAGSVRE